MTKFTPCGGCGADNPIDRCFGCFHDFRGSNVTVRHPSEPLYPDVPPLGPGDKISLTAPASRSPEWNRYYMGFAAHAATKSKDSTQVGASLVGPEGEIRLTGYNGIPRGVADLPERRERPAKYEWSSHAETNLIAFAAREGIRTKGCTVYVTHQPCAACTRTLIQAGIAKVVYGTGSFGAGSAMPAEMKTAVTMFAEAGIVCELA